MWSICLQSIYSIQEDKHRRWAALLHVLPEKAEKRNASTDVWLSASTSKAVKLPGMCVEACPWSDAKSWITRGSWMGEGRRPSCTIANNKSTGTGKPSWADDVQVQDISLLAKLLLQQHRTCLHRRVLLHGKWWSMQEPTRSDLHQWLRRKRRGVKRHLNCEIVWCLRRLFLRGSLSVEQQSRLERMINDSISCSTILVKAKNCYNLVYFSLLKNVSYWPTMWCKQDISFDNIRISYTFMPVRAI